jgi:DNA primase
MRIPEEKIEEIRTAADIVEIVGGFVRLKKAGRNFTGLCPFHREKTPSFNVNPERGIYKCFGCGRGGNAITFVMEIEGVSFVEAVTSLAERYNIPITRDDGPARASDEQLEELYAAARVAARFFLDVLQDVRGEAGRDYLDRRKWTAETRRTYGLGFAPAGWNNLLEHARAQGVRDDALEKSGLIIRNEAGRSYDRFRNRIVFPIWSATRKVLGFGARALAPDEHPKYINSPETPIYVKSRVVYGLAQAVQEIRQQDAVVLVEGYADVLSLHQAGVKHVVATSGTALTSDQVHLLARYTRNFLFLYDADSAGLNAMLRGLDLILEHDCDPRIVVLPQNEDPDSFIRAHGSDAMHQRLLAATSFVDFIAARYEQEGRLATPEGKALAVRHIVGLVARMDDRLRREFHVRQIAEKFRIYESIVAHELEDQLQQRRRGRPPELPAEGAAPKVSLAADPAPAEIPPIERSFMEQLLQADEEARGEALAAVRINMLTDSRLRELLHLLLEQQEHEGRADVDALWNTIEGDTGRHTLLADLMMRRHETSEHWREFQNVLPTDHRRAVLDAYRRIVLARLTARRARLQLRMRDTDATAMLEAARDLTALRALVQEIENAPDIAAVPDLGDDD